MDESAPDLITCRCNNCPAILEFEAGRAGETVQCPHCGIDTLLYIPSAPPGATPPPLPPVIRSPTVQANASAPIGAILVFAATVVTLGAIFGIAEANESQFAGSVAILGLFWLPLGGFAVLHLRPLEAEEVESLARKRRQKHVRSYYRFSHAEVAADKTLKSAMLGRGAFYSLRSPLEGFPALAAALLKYKKHEWVIIGFEKNREIDYIWLNKGQDNSQVRVRMSYAQMVNHARSGGHTTVIVLHNHPNPDPTTQSLLCPSKPDALSAQGLESALLPASINLLEFVCERGRFAEYHRAIAPSFMPIDDFIADVAAENGKTRGGNLLLHLERF